MKVKIHLKNNEEVEYEARVCETTHNLYKVAGIENQYLKSFKRSTELFFLVPDTRRDYDYLVFDDRYREVGRGTLFASELQHWYVVSASRLIIIPRAVVETKTKEP